MYTHAYTHILKQHLHIRTNPRKFQNTLLHSHPLSSQDTMLPILQTCLEFLPQTFPAPLCPHLGAASLKISSVHSHPWVPFLGVRRMEEVLFASKNGKTGSCTRQQMRGKIVLLMSEHPVPIANTLSMKLCPPRRTPMHLNCKDARHGKQHPSVSDGSKKTPLQTRTIQGRHIIAREAATGSNAQRRYPRTGDAAEQGRQHPCHAVRCPLQARMLGMWQVIGR